MTDKSSNVERQESEAARIRAVYERRCSLADRYSVFNAAHLQLLQTREVLTLRALRRAGVDSLDKLEVLDIGCGPGQWLHDLVAWGAEPERLHGIDLAEDRIQQARKRLPVGVHLQVGDASRMSFDNDCFDLVIQGTVFSSVVDGTVQVDIANEIIRVLRPGGLVLWYDLCLDSPRNRDVKGVSKARILELFRNCECSFKRTTLLPPLGRVIAPRSLFLYRCLESLPPLCSHYLGVMRKGVAHV